MVSTNFENDDLLKSLGTQLNVDFSNYDQWKRKERKDIRPQPQFKKLVPVQETTQFKVGLPPKSLSALPIGRRAQIRLDEENKAQEERISNLQMKISHSIKAREMYNKRAKELLELNLLLAEQINKEESKVHDAVKKLLRKYEKLRGGVAVLNLNFAREKAEAESDLKAMKKSIDEKLSEIQLRVDSMDSRLRAKQEETAILHSYKDKEYPVKAMTIANLHTEVQTIKHSQQEDEEELEHIINTELGKYEKQRIETANEITKNATEEAVSLMHPSLKDMALQNMVMKKEIEFHKEQHERLLESNKELEVEVEEMLKSPKSNVRLQMFPEFFPSKPKCTPDMEVELDIPRQQWLPI